MKHLIIIEDDDQSWKEDEQGLDPRNTRCFVPSRVAPTTTTIEQQARTSDRGRTD